MKDVREPVQKRSIEKKKKILDAGFTLFCEKGYYKTNTTEIAKRAGISTGALYSYFKDKKQIYIAAFHNYLVNISDRLLDKLSLQQPFSLPDFVESWICCYIDLYADTSRALAQLRMMISEDIDINRHFSNYENEYFCKITELLTKNDIAQDDLFEKVYTCCILIDALRQEKSAFSHDSLDFDIFKKQVKKTVIGLLSD
ncbi:MAG: TetR/AcrR family transcriptional regulator [Clostridiales bacterium]|nr:TetR/AcrR family transcriptional regulator [Clostridiales bacterium]